MIYQHSSNLMPELGDESIQCVITSPPYCMIHKWDTLFIQLIEEAGIPAYDNTPLAYYYAQMEILNRTWEECYRVLIPGGIMVVNIGDATRTIEDRHCWWPNYAYVTTSIHSLGFDNVGTIFWKKISNKPNAFLGSGFFPVNAYVRQDCEYFAIFRKGTKRIFTGDEIERRRASKFTKEERDIWFNQVWEGIPGKREAKQTSGWNLEVPRRFVRMYSIIGDTILDPFCGLEGGRQFEEICSEYSRKFIGYTIPFDYARYVEKQKRRICEKKLKGG